MTHDRKNVKNTENESFVIFLIIRLLIVCLLIVEFLLFERFFGLAWTRSLRNGDGLSLPFDLLLGIDSSQGLLSRHDGQNTLHLAKK